MNRYLTFFLFSFSLSAFIVMSINFFVDPFLMWNTTCVKDVTCKKTEAGDKIYLTKSFQWVGLKPDVVILGNSRPEMGLNPSSKSFKNKNIYNLSIRGASLEQQALYFSNLVSENKPKELLLAIDFFDFLVDKNKSLIWPKPLETDSYLKKNLLQQKNKSYNENYIKGHIFSLLSLDALTASLKTVFKQNSYSNYLLDNGFNVADGFIGIVKNEGIEASFEHSESMLKNSIKNKNLGLLDSNAESSPLKSLKYIIDLALKNEIKVTLFINPYHERYLKVINDVGKFELYLDWKIMLVNFLSENELYSKINFYDFSGFNEYTVEPVPKEKAVYMKWFWEPAHYRQELGEILLQEMSIKNSVYLLSNDNVIEKNATNRVLMKKLSLNEY